MRPHAVHTEAEECEILLTPVEGPVPVALSLTTAIDGAGQVVQEVGRRKAHERDTILELMPQANGLMLGHMKGIIGIVVPLEEFNQRQRFAESIHCALRAVQVDTTNAI